ncbi:MAG TPA: redoxin domain-containing protein [Verrucomicrobiae bacterium]|nr:redoxin domain-containing protein [Verrucomicrobiae bacterium]
MKGRAAIFALPALLFLAATPAATSATDPSAFRVGASAIAFTFVPIGGAPEPLVSPGKPTVVVAFASWCQGCLDEMPRLLADYAAFKDRVRFLGIDYLDNAKAGDATVAKYGIAYPVERVREAGGVPSPEPSANAAPASLTMHGVTPKMLPAVLPELKKALSASQYAAVADVAARCAALSDAACRSYAASKGIELDGGPVALRLTTLATGATISLPMLYVIDANGKIVDAIEGYDTGTDQLRSALAKLGIR